MNAVHIPYENSLRLLALLLSFGVVLGGIASAAVLTFVSKGRLRTLNSRLRVFIREEDGAAYGLSFIMMLPFYVFFMCVALEIMFMIVAKFGAVHAAQAAVRAAALRVAVSSPDDRDEWITPQARQIARKAAATALVPYASAVDPDYQKSTNRGVAYYNAYLDFVEKTGIDNPVSQLCVVGRYSSAEGRVDVTLEMDDDANAALPEDEPWRKCIKVSLVYRAPYQLPLIGRVLGGVKDGEAVVAEINAEASAQIECPRNESGFLGVAVPWGR